MASYTAQEVKRLREDTDAPMMECKSALEEAEGDFERAKNILREKGKAAAAKRAGRTTAEGAVAIALTPDLKVAGAIVLECETDFVATNESFVTLANEIAALVRDGTAYDDPQIIALTEGAVAKIRENIRVSKGVRVTSEVGLLTYVHHNRKSGSVIVLEAGDPTNEAAQKIAVQVAWSMPEVISKDQLSKDKIDTEIEIETQRALNEGKPENIARNIAQGRVNKEYVKRVVLLEQAFYADPSKTVDQYIKESAPGTKVKEVVYLAVGQ